MIYRCVCGGELLEAVLCCAVLPGLFCYQIIVLVQFEPVIMVQNSIFLAHFVVVFSADFVCISWYWVEVGNLHCLKLPTNVMF